MTSKGLCCDSLEEPKVLMKMGLSIVLVGHVNFLLGALVHGVVLRHINLHKQAQAMEYAISNVIALSSGLVTRSVFTLSFVAAAMAAASVIGLFVSVVRAIIHSGRSLLTHCRFPDAIGYSSVTNECPFDPTRIYSTTLILWVPLIVTCIVQLVFCARCFSVCMSFLGLLCCQRRKRLRNYIKARLDADTISRYSQHRQQTSLHFNKINTARPTERAAPSSYIEPERRPLHSPPPQSSLPPAAPPPPRQLHRQHRSLPPPERQPHRPPHRQRSDRGRSEPRAGDQRGAREQHQLLERGALERSSFWV
ncbi:transmembrane protein 54-like isoform X2 [Thalassophryne amazonica]|uniref:transmembrane protein 54-like isoform X2 n=1 Tax=Thalassophryne amazonica TaxID=390379 RepID=UPI0014726BB4|nr:transmembrane protein 54-like isoform X2 [Thalassophryne amazonica]